LPSVAFKDVVRPARRLRKDFHMWITSRRDKLNSFAIAISSGVIGLLRQRKKWPAIASGFGFAGLTPRFEAVGPSRVGGCASLQAFWCARRFH
jgi:hypothetical protein